MKEKVKESIDVNKVETMLKVPGLNNPENSVLTHNRFDT